MSKPTTWNCPLCNATCAYGTVGCDDPPTCDNPKNAAWVYYSGWYDQQRQPEEKPGTGIS